MKINECKSNRERNSSAKKPEPGLEALRLLSRFSSVLIAGALIVLSPVFCQRTNRPSGLSSQNTANNYDAYWNDVGKFLAGMDIEEGSRMAELAGRKEEIKHKEFLSDSWEKVESELLSPMRTWAMQEFPESVVSGSPVLYPFSGPDFLNIFTFFPDAPEYYLVGLEKTGRPPDLINMPVTEIPNYLRMVEKSLSSILNFSFFQTKHMARDLSGTDLGTGPILTMFVARTGNRVLNVYNVYVGSDGELHDGEYSLPELESAPVESPDAIPPVKSPVEGKEVSDKQETGREDADKEKAEKETKLLFVPGIRVLFSRPGKSEIQAVTFFSQDASNQGLAKNDLLIRFLKKRGPYRTFLKAASYLMHSNIFSRIREFILNESDFIIQDDSGMPISSFSPDYWECRFYGAYTRPIPLFALRYQADLREIYKNSEGIRPLPFGIGYRFHPGESNLMTARKKKDED